MLNTSQAYKALMEGRLIPSRIEILITNGTQTLLLTDADLVAESLNINWRSSNNKTLSLGTTYATSLSFSAMMNMEVELEGEYIDVTPTVYYPVAENQEEALPLGTYLCVKPTVNLATTYYECYDAMLKFDRTVESRFAGVAYNCLLFCCTACDMELGTTFQEASAFPNSNIQLTVDPARITTYRDAIGYFAMILGCYCVIGRDGKLYLKQHSTSPVATLSRHRRKNVSFAGYKTAISGVKASFLEDDDSYKEYKAVDEMKEGVILDLGEIPVLESFGTVGHAVKYGIVRSIYREVLRDLEYYPCEITLAGDPSFEAGDMISTHDREGHLKNILLTSVTFNYKASGGTELVSEGGNPKATNVSSSDKRSNQRNSSMALANSLIPATYINASAIHVSGSTAKEITNLRFVTNKDLTAIFGAEIPLYASADGYVNITYTNNGIDGDSVKARVHEGFNLITLVNHLYYDTGSIVILRLMADTEPLVPGGNVPAVTINENKIRSYIFAQGLALEAGWDGIIVINEDVGYVSQVLALYDIADGVTVSLYVPVETPLSAAVSAITTAVQTRSVSDTMRIELSIGEEYLRCGYGHRAGNRRMLARLSR